MTLRYSTGVSCLNSSEVIYNFKEFMKLISPTGPGWTVKMSGQGSTGTYSDSSDIITSTGVMSDNYWFVLVDPSGVREILIQASTSYSICIMYSKSSKFTGGTNIQRAIAADEVCIWGRYDNTVFGNYKSSSFFYSSYFPTYLHLWGDDSNQYSFGFYNRRQAATTNNSLFVMEECLNTKVSDPDNVAFICVEYGNAFTESILSNVNTILNGSGLRGFVKNRKFEDQFLGLNPIGLYDNWNTRTCPLGMGTDLISGNDYVFPILVLNTNTLTNTSPYYKGFFKHIMWQGNNRAKLSTITLNTTNDYIVIDEILLPWDGSTPVT